MPSYRVRPKQHLKRNGKIYGPGETVELTKEEVETMPWAVEPAKTKPGSPEVQKLVEERTRKELVEMARELGLSPDAKDNKTTIAEAIIQKQKQDNT